MGHFTKRNIFKLSCLLGLLFAAGIIVWFAVSQKQLCDAAPLAFEQVFDGSLGTENSRGSYGSPLPAFQSRSYYFPKNKVIKGAFYVMQPGERYQDTPPENPFVTGIYTYCYDRSQNGIVLQNFTLSTNVSDAGIEDFCLAFYENNAEDASVMQKIPLSLGDTVTLPLNIKRSGENDLSGTFNSGLFLYGMIFYEGKDYQLRIQV